MLASLATTRFVSAQIYGVSPTDPWLLGTVAIALGVAVAVVLIPADRARKVDPLSR